MDLYRKTSGLHPAPVPDPGPSESKTAQKSSSLLELGRGAASGLTAGLVASRAMNCFQSAILPVVKAAGGAQSSEPPATVKVANSAPKIVTGNRLDTSYWPAAGSAVHYGFGMLAASAYGATAEFRPAVTRWRGAAFGIGAATLVDQILVPVFGFARPPWRYTIATHAYGYASHIVFGLLTETLRKRLRATGRREEATAVTDPDRITMEDVLTPVLLGMANGQRTMTPPAVVSIAAATGALDLSGSRLWWLSSPLSAAAISAGAIGEYIIDVRPSTPPRTQLSGMVGRIGGGAVAGAATARPETRRLAAALGAGGAVIGALVSYRVRMRLSRALGRDRPAGFAEDMLSFAGTAGLTAFAALRTRALRKA